MVLKKLPKTGGYVPLNLTICKIYNPNLNCARMFAESSCAC